MISSAAAITACSFASFLFSPLASLRQLGFALVVGITVFIIGKLVGANSQMLSIMAGVVTSYAVVLLTFPYLQARIAGEEQALFVVFDPLAD